jgi:hypothetical protein
MSGKIEILRIGWDTWNEMCDFIGVGTLAKGKPEGTFLNEEGWAIEGFPGDFSGNMGILFPSDKGLVTGKTGDYVVKFDDGAILLVNPAILEATIDLVEAASIRVNNRLEFSK